jgi:hypothetical protein
MQKRAHLGEPVRRGLRRGGVVVPSHEHENRDRERAHALVVDVQELGQHAAEREDVALVDGAHVRRRVLGREQRCVEEVARLFAKGGQAAVELRPLAGDDDALARDRLVARVGRDALHLLHGCGVAARLRLLQTVIEADPLVVARADDLTDPDVRVEQIRSLHRRAEADHGAPAVRHQDHFALAVTLADVLGELDRVIDVTRDVQAGRDRVRVILYVSLARAALIVVHDREVLFQRTLELPQRRNQRRGRPAMHEQDDRVRLVLAAHVDPLVDAADLRLVRLLDAVRGNDAIEIGNRVACLLVRRDVRALLRASAETHCGKSREDERSRSHAFASSSSLPTVRQFRAVVSTPSSRSAFAASFETPKPSGA